VILMYFLPPIQTVPVTLSTPQDSVCGRNFTQFVLLNSARSRWVRQPFGRIKDCGTTYHS